MRTSKDIFNKAIRTKWVFKKHTHASVKKIYELRGRLGRQIRIWERTHVQPSSSLTHYKAMIKYSKRVTSGYSREYTVG